jgi:hypothetical protein
LSWINFNDDAGRDPSRVAAAVQVLVVDDDADIALITEGSGDTHAGRGLESGHDLGNDRARDEERAE